VNREEQVAALERHGWESSRNGSVRRVKAVVPPDVLIRLAERLGVTPESLAEKYGDSLVRKLSAPILEQPAENGGLTFKAHLVAGSNVIASTETAKPL
jgi:hypothetical protein